LNRHLSKLKNVFSKKQIPEKPQREGNGQMERHKFSKRFSPAKGTLCKYQPEPEHPFRLLTDGAVYRIIATPYQRRRRQAKATAQLKICRRRRSLI
jgi:hypothetical protein